AGDAARAGGGDGDRAGQTAGRDGQGRGDPARLDHPPRARLQRDGAAEREDPLRRRGLQRAPPSEALLRRGPQLRGRRIADHHRHCAGRHRLAHGRSHLRGVQGHRQFRDHPRPQADGEARLSLPRHQPVGNAQGRAADGRQAAQPRLDPAAVAASSEHHRFDGIPLEQDARHEDEQGIPRLDEPVKRLFGPPLIALLAARAVSAAAALWAGVNPLHGDAWVRWDSNLYLSIAQRGYFLEHCGPGSHYEPWQWCGNAGWFPLYAWMLRLFPGALLSLVFEAALLILIWRTLLREQGFSALLLAALFPGCIYQQAVFPASLFLLCAVLFLATERAFVPGALAGMAYPTGFLLVPVALIRRRFWAAAG